MKTPTQVLQQLNSKIKDSWKVAFFAAFIMGLMTHLPMMLSDFPNHDGLDSIYFDQNMITSGRWFLTIACGMSSYFSIPWVISIFGILFLSLSAVALTELFELENKVTIISIAGILVTFPAICSTFAYVFTLDGYMMALLFAILAVLLVKKGKWGFIAGGIFLGLSLGVYQAYLPVTVLLCMTQIIVISLEQGDIKKKIAKIMKFLYMGIIGIVVNYGMLYLLLAIENKQLANYQGINGEGGASVGILQRIAMMYRDFLAFTIKGNVFYNNVFSAVALILLALSVLNTFVFVVRDRKLWKSVIFFGIMVVLLGGLPIACNLILLVSPDVTYHLLMRYQWGILIIIALALVEKYGNPKSYAAWGAFLGAVILCLNYFVTDNIAYSNLEKKYEKTYAYCVRLLDRIEQTDGYYQGIPIAMIGVVSEDAFPKTDITDNVTGGMIGMNGDMLLYTGKNYQAFMKHYLGATLNILEPEVMADIYYTNEYMEMNTFPGENSIQVVDGVMYIKTENSTR